LRRREPSEELVQVGAASRCPSPASWPSIWERAVSSINLRWGNPFVGLEAPQPFPLVRVYQGEEGSAEESPAGSTAGGGMLGVVGPKGV
jgi:hypothetical protein